MSICGRAYYAPCRTRPGHVAARAVVRGLRRAGLLTAFRTPLDALELEHPAVAGLMELWSRTHWSSGDGMMPPDQLLAVYRLAASWPMAGDTVELGSWVGLTTGYLAAACRVRGEGRVGAVDAFAGTKEGGATYPSIERYDLSTLPALREHLGRAGVADFVTPLVGLTTDVAGAYPGRPIRFLLIDADHSYGRGCGRTMNAGRGMSRRPG